MTSSFFRRSKPQQVECYYSILQVSKTATLQDIKLSYRKLALQLHPDQHGGKKCPEKQAAFQKVNQAYQVLSNTEQRVAYDREHGHYYNNYNYHNNYKHNHHYSKYQAGATPHYRKVYAPKPPPEWNGYVWNHAYHYEMHYGTGMQKQAIEQAFRHAKKEGGALEYESPLGKGFSFVSPDDDNDNDDSNHPKHHHHHHHIPPINTNPYSKYAPQGPPKMTVEYEEGSMEYNTAGRMHVHKRETIVQDMFRRRSERRQQQTKHTQSKNSNQWNPKNGQQAQSQQAQQSSHTNAHQRQQQQQHPYQRFQHRYNATTFGGGLHYQQPRNEGQDDCVIL